MNRDETQVRLYTYNPSNVTDMEKLLLYDRWAKRAIEDAENLIQEAQAYRLQLADRVRKLQEMRFHVRVTLKRNKDAWTGKIHYSLKTEKAYEDGTAQELDISTFEGKERHKAIAEFRALKKRFPGYEFVEDIQKSRWER